MTEVLLDATDQDLLKFRAEQRFLMNDFLRGDRPYWETALVAWIPEVVAADFSCSLFPRSKAGMKSANKE